MRAVTRIIERLRRRRALAWALLAALGICQIAVVGHEATHSLTDTVETCQLCAQLDENDVPQPVAGAFAGHATAETTLPQQPQAKQPAKRRDTKTARGPPHS